MADCKLGLCDLVEFLLFLVDRKKSMPEIADLIAANRLWAARMEEEHPGFFAKLTNQQSPEFLWIGCSDSRVPANEIVGLLPGELFVHRNVANLVKDSDFNCQSVLQFAVDILKVKHIIVCGHYGCGGVRTALSNQNMGLSDNWLRTLKDIYSRERATIDAIEDPRARLDAMCELNVRSQVTNVVHTKIVQHAWHRGQKLAVHGWVYDVSDGIVRDLGVSVRDMSNIEEIYRFPFE